ncbi:unnamed protein product [Camellia sinensis]
MHCVTLSVFFFLSLLALIAPILQSISYTIPLMYDAHQVQKKKKKKKKKKNKKSKEKKSGFDLFRGLHNNKMVNKCMAHCQICPWVMFDNKWPNN